MKNVDKNTICDIMNGASYKYEPDTLNLIIFVDSATFTKSGHRSQYATMSSIVEMPSVLRFLPENIIFHSSWSGSEPDFNLYFEKYNNEIDVLLNNGLDFNDTHYKFKVHLFIADKPAQAKGCVCSAFNGKYGCIKCLHPTIYNTKTIYPKLSTVQGWKVIKKDRDGNVIKVTLPFKDLKAINLRTNKIYNEQVEIAVENGCTYQGIKGEAYLAKWIKVPRGIYFDKMHTSDIGTFKTTFNGLLDNQLCMIYLKIFSFNYC